MIDISIFDDLPDFSTDKQKNSLKFKNTNFALTGTIGHLSRKDIERRISLLGGSVTSVASAHYLVVGDAKGSRTAKIKSAEKRGIPFIQADDFMADLLKALEDDPRISDII